MKWIKFGLIFLALLVVGYWASSYFVDESETFTIEKEINYPIEKVYPQFNNLQNFTRWNEYFKDHHIQYFQPYEGVNSALKFISSKTNGEMFIRYENPLKTIKYQLFEEGDKAPFIITTNLKIISPEKTKIIWEIHTPERSLLKSSTNIWNKNNFVENIQKSMTNLSHLLSNKVDREELLASVKYDSLMIEKSDGNLLLGVSVSTSNKGDLLYKNIVMNHSKVFNFITIDLDKNEDEFGFPVLVTDANNFKDKEVSYYYGIPVSKRISISDNNFIFKTLNESKQYSIYYKGDYKNRVKAIQTLLQKAKKDTMRYGELQQTFLSSPEENQPVNMKISLPVYK